MCRWKELLSELGDVIVFDYPYMQAGRRSPDPFPRLLEAHRKALVDAGRRRQSPGVLVGKSMGGRVGCHLSLEQDVRALICLGYPLKSPGKSGKLRDEVLVQMRSPVLFVQGTRDPLCPLDILEDVRSRMTAPNELHVVQTGNHSLEATKTYLKTSEQTQEDLDRDALASIRRFLELVGGRPRPPRRPK